MHVKPERRKRPKLPLRKPVILANSRYWAYPGRSASDYSDAWHPHATPLCGTVAAMVSIEDLADRSPRPLADGEVLSLARHRVRWHDAPHLPHAWECGFLSEELTRTLLCGDLYTQGGADLPPVTESDILGPSEEFHKRLDYFSYTMNTPALLEKLASTEPETLACMHGSSWSGDEAKLLRDLADSLTS